MGDGLLVYFGYPLAGEHDPEKRRASGEGNRSLCHPDKRPRRPDSVQVRVGIATGGVVVGDLIGQGVAQEQAVVGETPNLAKRLAGARGSGQRGHLGGRRRRLVGRACSSTSILACIRSRASTCPCSAWSVGDEAIVESRFEALRSHPELQSVGRPRPRNSSSCCSCGGELDEGAGGAVTTGRRSRYRQVATRSASSRTDSADISQAVERIPARLTIRKALCCPIVNYLERCGWLRVATMTRRRQARQARSDALHVFDGYCLDCTALRIAARRYLTELSVPPTRSSVRAF